MNKVRAKGLRVSEVIVFSVSSGHAGSDSGGENGIVYIVAGVLGGALFVTIIIIVIVVKRRRQSQRQIEVSTTTGFENPVYGNPDKNSKEDVVYEEIDVFRGNDTPHA